MKSKRLKRVLHGIGAAALSICMLAGGAINVKAEDTDKPLTTDMDLRITKNLVIPENTISPDATYTFKFAALGIEDADGKGGVVASTDSLLPAIDDYSIAYTTGDIGTSSNNIIKEGQGSALQKGGSALTAADFPHAGVYIYKITEESPASPVTGITYAKEEYRVKIYVKNNAAQTALEFAGYTVNKDKDADGTVTNTKVDGAPGGKGIEFTNKYSEKTNLKITNLLAGTHANLTQKFTYKLTITVPVTESATTVSYKVNGSGAATTMNSGTEAEITFGHKDYIYFEDIPVGSTYSLSIVGVDGFDIASEVTGNGASGTNVSAGTDAGHTVQAGGSSNILIAKEDATLNTVEVTGTYKTVSPTGIIIDSIPFIAILLVAFAGLTFFVNRKRKGTN